MILTKWKQVLPYVATGCHGGFFLECNKQAEKRRQSSVARCALCDFEKWECQTRVNVNGILCHTRIILFPVEYRSLYMLSAHCV